MKRYLNAFDLPTVPVLDYFYTLPDTVEEILNDATGNSTINNKVLREGLVLRRKDEFGKIISFKAVSPEFLMKHNM